MHPNDEVNATQSSNDTFPSAIHLAATRPRSRTWCRRSEHLADALDAQGRRIRRRVKAGRTHLMDATPVTLGQELGGYAAQVRLRRRAARAASCPGSRELPLGGTAVGTGINTPPGFAAAVIADLDDAPGCRSPRRATTSRPRGPGTRSSSSRSRSDRRREPDEDLQRPAVDGLGAAAGLGEIHLPDLQPGS